jgi:hypothetical protein
MTALSTMFSESHLAAMACRPGILGSVHGHIRRILILFVVHPKPSAARHTSSNNISLLRSVSFALPVFGRSSPFSGLLPPLLSSCLCPGRGLPSSSHRHSSVCASALSPVVPDISLQPLLPCRRSSNFYYLRLTLAARKSWVRHLHIRKLYFRILHRRGSLRRILPLLLTLRKLDQPGLL